MRYLLPVLSAAFALASAQSQNITINPGTVDPGTRGGWCGAQFNTCRTLCANAETANECDSETLEYNCLCSNGSAPGLQYYIQTMPTFICEKAFSDCIAANTGSARAQEDCKTNIKSQCGTLDPNEAQVDGGDNGSEDAATTSSTTATTSGTQSPTADAAGAATTTSTSTAGVAPTGVAYFGNGVAAVAAGVFAALL